MEHRTLDDVTSQRVDLRTWRRVAGFALRHPWPLAGLVLTALTTAACDVLFPLVTRAMIDALARDGAAVRLTPYALGFAALALVLAAGVWSFIRMAGHVATHVAHDIR